jgi:hypothetical protein
MSGEMLATSEATRDLRKISTVFSSLKFVCLHFSAVIGAAKKKN